jgi:hypothetical protein
MHQRNFDACATDHGPGVALLTVSALTITGCGTSIGTNSRQDTNIYTITDPITSVTVSNRVGNPQIEATDATTTSVTEQLRYTGNPHAGNSPEIRSRDRW